MSILDSDENRGTLGPEPPLFPRTYKIIFYVYLFNTEYYINKLSTNNDFVMAHIMIIIIVTQRYEKHFATFGTSNEA